jgi:glycosyltransferase involved in cell wall biosynthesis
MRFSIIIPTHNRPALLDRCLTAIGALHYPRAGFEVLVVDDGSDPPPDDIIARHASLLPLRYYRHGNRGPARTRNYALHRAQGEYVVFTDDDCAPREDWLTAFDRAFTDHPAAGLGGRIVDAPDNGIYGIASQLLVTFLYDADTSAGKPKFFCSNNLAFGRQRLLETGGFEEAYPLAAAEDRDICARWLLQHGELHFVQAAVVEHRQDLNLTSFCAQQFRYGRGAFQFWSRRRAEGHSANRLESWRWRMFLFPFSRASFPRALSLSALLALSQLACAAGYLAERRKK